MKWIVEVEIISRRTKEITVYARDETEAMDKAETLVSGWDGVDSAEALSAEPE